MTALTAIVGLSAYALQIHATFLLARLSVRSFRLAWRLRKNGLSAAAT